jgi:AraC-like DNA-binding protein
MARRIKDVTTRCTGTVSAAFVRALFDLASANGASPHELASRSSIDPAQLAEADRRVALASYIELMRAAQELCSDAALALHLGASPSAGLEIGCLIGSFAETGSDAFALFNRYSRLCVDVDCAAEGDRFVLTQSGGQVWIVDTRANANDFPELTELTFAGMASAARGQIKAVHVTHPAPPYRAEYDRVFGVPVVFENDRNALLLNDDAWLSERPQSTSPIVLDALKTRAESLLEDLDDAKTFKTRVQKVLMPILASNEVGVAAVAAKLRVSRQTLFRRLKAEGTTFEHVLDELRHKMAVHYLHDKKASVDETAYLVGFSDRSAFARAFKRWTGTTPGRLNPAKRS